MSDSGEMLDEVLLEGPSPGVVLFLTGFPWLCLEPSSRFGLEVQFRCLGFRIEN